MRWPRLVFVLVLICCGAAHAELKLPAIISDNMVLQKGPGVPVWGWADKGEKVTVRLAGQTATATADGSGAWQVLLNLAAAGPGPLEMTVAGAKDTRTVKNILVGEVWLASGQSNMEFDVSRGQNAQEEIAAADFPEIRHFHAAYKTSLTPWTDTMGTWEVCAPATVGHFTAVGYYFARELHKQLSTPVGIVHTSWGGTPAEAWTSAQGIKDFPNYQAVLDKLSATRDDPHATPINSNTPTVLFNAMVSPLIPYRIAGVIWYQGENNAGHAYEYRTLFPALIADWRGHWNHAAPGSGKFAFYFVQLANYMDINPQPGEAYWAELREAQTMTLAVPDTGMAVAIDIGEAADIHPRNKQEVGRRLAWNALARHYGRGAIEYAGPVYEKMTVQGAKVRLKFTHATGGLVAKTLPATYQPRSSEPATKPLPRFSPDSTLQGFAVCGADHKFVWAKAEIVGDSVVVSSPQIPAPVAVRYGWAENPICNLYNGAGLPAGPFRTDDFPGLTMPKPGTP